jgi:hypothetical protein
MCIDYRKLNLSTCKYHFLLPFMDQMFEHLAGKSFITFLMDIVDIIRLLLILEIKKRLHFHVHLVYMHIGECSLVSIMHL